MLCLNIVEAPRRKQSIIHLLIKQLCLPPRLMSGFVEAVLVVDEVHARRT